MRGGTLSVRSGRRRAGTILAIVAALPALLGGCGGDDDGSDAGAAPGTSAEAADLLASRPLSTAGDAPAAEGSGLEESPGPEDRAQLEGFGEVAIAIRAPDGSVMGWCVLLADREEQRQRGLMEVTDFGGYAGMLFVWNEDSSSQFYMRNTPTPLSIAWFDAQGELVSTADMAPCGEADDCPLYGAERPYRFALEVPQGELASLGIEEGSELRVGGHCTARSP